MLVSHRRLCPPQASISIQCCGRICHFPITAIRDRNRPLPQMVPVMEAESAPIKARELAKVMAQALGREPKAISAARTKARDAAEAADRRVAIQTTTLIGYSNRPKS